MRQKILYKFTLVILGVAILSLILVTNKSQAVASQVSVTAKVDPTLTFSVGKKSSQSYELIVSTNYSNGFIINLSEEESIIVQEKGTKVIDIHTLILTENFIYAKL